MSEAVYCEFSCDGANRGLKSPSGRMASFEHLPAGGCGTVRASGGEEL